MDHGPPTPPPTPSRRARAAAALVIALAWTAYYVAHVRANGPGYLGDVTLTWAGARAILDGQDPWAVVGGPTASVFPWPWPLYYPMTTLVAMLPLALVSMAAARVIFVAASAWVCAYAVTRDGWWRLMILASGPMFHSVMIAQFSPLMTAAACWPAAAWLAAIKPNYGVVVVAAADRRSTLVIALVGGVVLAAVGLVIDPMWPAKWLRALGGVPQTLTPVASHPLGALSLLALLRWRRPEARLLAAMACIPTNGLVYEAMPVLLVARQRTELAVLTVLSLAAFAVQVAVMSGRDWFEHTAATRTAMAALIYLPALVMVLRRPNEGAAPAWIERALVRLRVPRWLSGRLARD